MLTQLIAPAEAETRFDLTRTPVLNRLFAWRHARTLLQFPLLLISAVMVVDGLFGPSLAPKNLATTLTWVHFRGLLVLVLLGAGNFFCLACPFMLVRNGVRRFIQPWFAWPRFLRNKWLSAGLFVLVLFMYELFDLWSSPWWTAWLIVGYFASAVLVDSIFKHAAFCKYVCPVGQFNFVASLLSPLEVAVREPAICRACHTKDCIRGRRDPASSLVTIQRGCELALFQPAKVGNMDCTFCLDCVHACPHDNVGILSRPPAAELLSDPVRSGVGRFSKRWDLAALATVFTFGALLNAFGMVTPVYAVEKWLGALLGASHEAPVLGLIFVALLVLAPALLFGSAALVNGGAWAVRYIYGLIPLGFGMWLAHYGFHFFTGLFTVVPLTQYAVASLGSPLLGNPQWRWTGLPLGYVQILETGFLLFGFAGSLMLMYRLAEQEGGRHRMRAFVPWAAVCLVLWLASLWLMAQPMEMRATFM